MSEERREQFAVGHKKGKKLKKTNGKYEFYERFARIPTLPLHNLSEQLFKLEEKDTGSLCTLSLGLENISQVISGGHLSARLKL